MPSYQDALRSNGLGKKRLAFRSVLPFFSGKDNRHDDDIHVGIWIRISPSAGAEEKQPMEARTQNEERLESFQDLFLYSTHVVRLLPPIRKYTSSAVPVKAAAAKEYGPQLW
jgi:hypothetical protein